MFVFVSPARKVIVFVGFKTIRSGVEQFSVIGFTLVFNVSFALVGCHTQLGGDDASDLAWGPAWTPPPPLSLSGVLLQWSGMDLTNRWSTQCL